MWILRSYFISFFIRNFDRVRPVLTFDKKFGLYESHRVHKYINCELDALVSRLKISGHIKNFSAILQTNPARARVIFLATNETGQKIVVKWVNYSAPLTYNFIGGINTHPDLFTYQIQVNCSLIPKVLHQGKDFSIHEYVVGKSILTLIQHQDFTSILKNLLSQLIAFYRSTNIDVCHVCDFNRSLVRDITYMTQIRSRPTFWSYFFLSITSSHLQKLYVELLRKIDFLISKPNMEFISTLCFHDLDLQNILYDDVSSTISIVDTEDMYRGYYLFDLAWLTSRIYLAHDPVQSFKKYDSQFIAAIADFEGSSNKDTIILYRCIVCLYLLLALINSSLIPKNSSNQLYHCYSIYKLLLLHEKSLFHSD